VAGLSLDTSSGTLAPGEAAQIGVSLTADLQALAGPADVVITWGDGKTADIPVSWAVVPLPVVPRRENCRTRGRNTGRAGGVTRSRGARRSCSVRVSTSPEVLAGGYFS
jgi:hypothetical protein